MSHLGMAFTKLTVAAAAVGAATGGDPLAAAAASAYGAADGRSLGAGAVGSDGAGATGSAVGSLTKRLRGADQPLRMQCTEQSVGSAPPSAAAAASTPRRRAH